MIARASVLLALMIVSACGMDPAAPDHDEASDFDPVAWSPDGKADVSGVPVTFDKNAIIDDHTFTAASAVDGDAVQAFLEHSPYGRSWLASYQLDGVRFADRIVQIARADGLDPVVLLVRLQVESSVVSKSTQPGAATLAYAMGCGCPDGSACSHSYRGLSAQLQCAADTYKQWFDASADGTGEWRASHTLKSLDGVSVTPHSNATASIYAYTPWVLVNRGGSLLTWNVSRRFLKAFDDAGTLQLP